MQFWETIAIAVSLSMDAFAVAISSGMKLKCLSGRQVFRLAFHFGFFQAAMPVAGWFVGALFQRQVEAFDHWIAFALLAFVGWKMVFEAFTHKDGDDEKTICDDPTKGFSLVALSVATSIDAFAIGLSLSMLGVGVWRPAVVIGFTAAAFTAVGMRLGAAAASKFKIGKYAEVLGGLVLVVLSIKILREHGVF